MTDPAIGGTGPATPQGGAARGPVSGVNILVPGSWYEFDIHPASRDESIDAVVKARVAERPELAEARSGLVKTLRRIARDAWSNGVLYCGAMAEVLEDEAMTANVTIAVTDARNETTGEYAPNSPDAILAGLTEVPEGRRPTDPWRRVRIVNPPEVGRPSVRTEGIEDIEVPNDARMLRMVMMQTFVPFPDGDPRVAVISAGSPQLALTEPMLALFDQISDTFRFVHDEPGHDGSRHDDSPHNEPAHEESVDGVWVHRPEKAS